jgi:hypothetical protein
VTYPQAETNSNSNHIPGSENTFGLYEEHILHACIDILCFYVSIWPVLLVDCSHTWFVLCACTSVKYKHPGNYYEYF